MNIGLRAHEDLPAVAACALRNGYTAPCRISLIVAGRISCDDLRVVRAWRFFTVSRMKD
jgi:hypothetical protein